MCRHHLGQERPKAFPRIPHGSESLPKVDIFRLGLFFLGYHQAREHWADKEVVDKDRGS